MKIEQLIKLINDVKKITKQNKIMLFGSQAIYSKIKDVESDTILNSMEADFTLYSYKDKKELENFVDMVDIIGEFSPYHTTYGFYAEGVSSFNESFPKNYKNRLINFQYSNDKNDIIQFMNIKDVVIMKLRRMDPKDHDFIEYLIEKQLIKLDDIIEIIDKEYMDVWKHSKGFLIDRIKFILIIIKTMK